MRVTKNIFSDRISVRSKKLKKLHIAIILISLIFLYACSRGAAPQKSLEKPVVQPPAAAEKTFDSKWQQLVNSAKKEGRIVIFNSGTFVGARQAASKAFKDKFGIDIEFTSGGASDIAERNLRERRAGIHAVDVQISGAASFVRWYLPEGIIEPLEPVLMLPEVLDSKSWIGGSLRFLDSQKRVIAFGAGVAPQFLYNTDLVKPEEMKSFRDLLNPKWKGKIAMHYPLEPGAGQQNVSAIGSVLLGWDILRDFARQEPFITREHHLLVDWVAKGKYSIAAFIQQGRGAELERAGAPVKMITIPDASYIGSSGCLLGLVNRAPHPDAAKLFINWLLSREGQSAVYRDMGIPSARIDVSTEGISPVLIPDPSRKYFSSENIEWVLKQQERDREIASIFSPLLR